MSDEGKTSLVSVPEVQPDVDLPVDKVGTEHSTTVLRVSKTTAARGVKVGLKLQGHKDTCTRGLKLRTQPTGARPT